MHYHRLFEPGEPGYVRGSLGKADSALYFTDDGPDHCMASRRVGRSPDGSEYCLVARISLFRYQELRDREVAVDDAFSDARDICLCGVFEDESASDVIVVQHYRHVADIPDEYLPPAPFIEFSDPPASD
jgi:hypothetical protein